VQLNIKNGRHTRAQSNPKARISNIFDNGSRHNTIDNIETGFATLNAYSSVVKKEPLSTAIPTKLPSLTARSTQSKTALPSKQQSNNHSPRDKGILINMDAANTKKKTLKSTAPIPSFV
jgi:hypothetical protein